MQRRLIEIALVPLPNVPASERVASLRRIPLDGNLSDVVPLPDCRPAGPKPVASFTGARGAGPGMMVPFSAVQRRAIDTQGYLWCSPGGEYRIERYRIGSPEKPLVLTRTNALQQVPKASYDSAIAVVNAFKARWVGGNTDPTLVPRNFPAIEGLAVDNKSCLSRNALRYRRRRRWRAVGPGCNDCALSKGMLDTSVQFVPARQFKSSS